MSQYHLNLSYASKDITIVLPYFDNTSIVFPSFAPFPLNDKSKRLEVYVTVNDFEHDIHGMMPTIAQGHPFDSTVNNLHNLIQEHLSKYKRLMPGDFFTYINEAVYLYSVIAEQAYNQPLAEGKGEEYFAIIFKIMWSAFTPEMKDLIIKQSAQDPLTNYILTKLAQ
jgi:hypothetical protein